MLALLSLAGCQPQTVRNTNRGVFHLSVEGDAREPALDQRYELGTVVVGARKELVVRATNVGVDSMTVLGASRGSTGNGSWFLRDVSGLVAPGAFMRATITFAPASTGMQSTTVTFSHDADAALPSLLLTGAGG